MNTLTPNIMNGLEHLKKAKKIPSFCGLAIKQFKLAGHDVTLMRAPASKSIPAFARLMKTFGELMTHTVSYDDDGNPEKVALASLFDAGMDSEQMKEFLLATAMPEIMKSVGEVGYTDFHYYYETLLPGSMIVDGVSIDTKDELDELGLTPPQVGHILFKAAEVNFYPTSGDLGTPVGEESPEATPEPEQKPQPETKTRSKKRGGTRKVGQSARTRSKRG